LNAVLRVVGERAELDAADLAQRTTDPSGFERTTTSPNSSAVIRPPARPHGVGHLLAGRHGLGADLTRGLTVLCC
jgi:hypothetical protein